MSNSYELKNDSEDDEKIIDMCNYILINPKLADSLKELDKDTNLIKSLDLSTDQYPFKLCDTLFDLIHKLSYTGIISDSYKYENPTEKDYRDLGLTTYRKINNSKSRYNRFEYDNNIRRKTFLKFIIKKPKTEKI